MNNEFEKIGAYRVINYLLPGAVFCYAFEVIIDQKIIRENIIESIFLYYFIGLVLSRIGSLVVEPKLKKCKFIKFEGYRDYIFASEKDNMIKILSEENNSYRTFLTGGILLLILKVCCIVIDCLKIKICVSLLQMIIIVLLIMLFLFSYKKQTNKIADRVKIIKKEAKK